MSYSTDGCYDVYRETRTRCRKDRLCSACKSTIRARDFYYRVAFVFEGTAESLSRCLACQAIHDHLKEMCRNTGDLWPAERLNCGLDYVEEWGPLPDKIAALAFMTPDELQAELGGPLHRPKQISRALTDYCGRGNESL